MRTGYKNNRVDRRYWLIVALPLLLATGAVGLADEGSASAAAPASADLLSGARGAIQQGDWQRGLELTDEALHHGANKVQVLLLEAQIYAGMGNVEKQRQVLQSVVALDSSLCEPQVTLARLEENRGLWPTAAELYQRAIDADAGCRAAYLRLAELYEKNNQPRQALRVLQQGADNNPGDTRLLMALADMFRRRDLLQQAEAVYGQIVTGGDESAKAEAHRRLGEIYWQVQQYADAFECYVKAAELQGGPGAIDTAGYQEMFKAADGAVTDALEGAWGPFTAYTEGGPVAREEAYVAMWAAVEQINQAYEAALNAQIYLDGGNKHLRDAACQRRYQAKRERELLPVPSSP